MAKPKRKLTAKQRAEKKRRRQEYMTIFVGGKQKRVKRPPTIDGMSEETFIRNNADPVWYHQNEMWEEIDAGTLAWPNGVDIAPEALYAARDSKKTPKNAIVRTRNSRRTS